MIVSYVVRVGWLSMRDEHPDASHLLLGVVTLPVWILLFSRYRLYASRFVTSRLEEFGRLFHASGASVLAVAAIAFMLKLPVSRAWLTLSFVAAVILLTVERDLVRRTFTRLHAGGRLLRPVVIVGSNSEAVALCRTLVENPSLGYSVAGIVDDQKAGSTICDRAVIGPISNTRQLVKDLGVCGVLLVTTSISADTSNRLVRELTDAGVHVELTSSLSDIAAERLSIRPLARFPVMYVEPVRMIGWRAAAKRGFEVVVASTVLPLLSPLLLLVALCIKFDSSGPILFRQQRVGRHGTPFTMFKFRTMVTSAEQHVADLARLNDADGALFKLRRDPRVTRVGRILRKYSIDEIPQLWNILRGEMSLVGPRPALPWEMRGWAPELHNRLRVRPGVTGMWQVSGRADSRFADDMRLDLYYVDNWSLWRDLAILAKTVPTVLSARGAY
ncbi:MAG: sugar transferase [Actinomycetota bacterium]|nr:sugar transferase [Actinomycetota bacterium]